MYFKLQKKENDFFTKQGCKNRVKRLILPKISMDIASEAEPHHMLLTMYWHFYVITNLQKCIW